MTDPLDRREALTLLRLPPSAGTAEVKRAYRRLARDHHPDVGGDTARFHELQLAYELLLDFEAAPRPARPRGRPSRHRAAWDRERDGHRGGVDLEGVAWDAPLPDGAVTLDRATLERLLAAGAIDRPCGVAVATSRAPGSRLNRSAARLSTDVTAELRVAPDRDDRGRIVVATTVRTSSRRARRALDAAPLDGDWLRLRRSTTTTLRRTAEPDADPRTTAVRTVDELEDLLDRLSWPLPSWTLTPKGH